MKRKPHSTSLVLLLLCIFTFWWGISVLAQHDTLVATATPSLPTTPAVTTAAPLLVNGTSKNGTFTYSGVYTPQNACDSFGSGIRYRSNEGGHVSILLITAPSSAACAQAAGITNGQSFSVSIKLSVKDIPQFDGVLLNGAAIPAQLVQIN